LVGWDNEYKSPVFDIWDIGTCRKEIFKPWFDVMAFGDCKLEEIQNPIQQNKRIKGNLIGNLRHIEVVIKSPVKSGYLPYLALTETKTG
jgi:hypothetical protein